MKFKKIYMSEDDTERLHEYCKAHAEIAIKIFKECGWKWGTDDDVTVQEIEDHYYDFALSCILGINYEVGVVGDKQEIIEWYVSSGRLRVVATYRRYQTNRYSYLSFEFFVDLTEDGKDYPFVMS